jgi:hypothetical protein
VENSFKEEKMDIVIGKAIASVAVAAVVGVIGWKTQNPTTLWGLLIVVMVWGS